MKRKAGPKKLTVVLGIVVAILILLLACVLLTKCKPEEPDVTEPQTEAPVVVVTEAPTEAPTEPTEPAETEPVMLDFMAEWYNKYPEVVGWLRIDDTIIDYPVVFTPEEPEKYLRMNLDGEYSVGGTLFIDGKCSMDPESMNILIYGHNMSNGTMFRKLMDYKKESFWEKHPEIYFSTLYEERTYEIISVFYDRVYFNYEDVFKFYQFIDAEDEADFANAMENYKEKAMYDTGVTAEYGDRLLTLITCSYHHDYGRFVVVAREKTDAAVEAAE